MEWKDYLAKVQEERRIHKAKPWFERTLIDIYEYFRYRFLYQLSCLPRASKFWYQEVTRGYSDADVWNLNSFIVRQIYKPLKKFINTYEESGRSLPLEFATDPAAWLLILKKIEFSFDHLWKDDNDADYWPPIFNKSDEEIKEFEAKVEEGLVLFGKHIRDLWD